MEKKKFLVKQVATVGRTTEEGADQPPIYLRFYTVVEAEGSTEALHKAVKYMDPGFKTEVEEAVEMGRNLSAETLSDMLDPSVIISTKPF